MGISLEQYRSAIGCWNNNKARVQHPEAPIISLDDSDDTSRHHSDYAGGPWKLHALALLLIVTTCILCQGPPNLQRPISSSRNGVIPSAACFSYQVPTTGNSDQQSLIPSACIRMLLMIGGIEPNPGPDTNEQIAEMDQILADLSSNAPSNDIRNAIRAYDPRLDLKALETAIRRRNRDNLVDTMEYLEVENPSEYSKEGLVTAVICRIQNLLPDKCNLCNEQYCVKLSDTPLLSCYKCGQGTHDSCILDFLNVKDEERSSFTSDDARNKIDPTKLSGLTFLCRTCTEAYIPSENVGKLNKKKKTKPVEIVASHDTTSPQDSSNNGGNPEGNGIARKHTQDTGTNTNLTPPGDQEKENHPAASSDDPSKDTSPASTEVCPHYRKGTCRHGVAGRQCSKLHPKACKKLLAHGNRAPKGCTAGNQCEKYHPVMCQSSLRKRECFNADCKAVHIPGTKRVRPEKERNESRSKEARQSLGNTNVNRDKQNDTRDNRNGDKQNVPNGNQQDYFLDALHAMRKELMQEMESIRSMVRTPTAGPTAPFTQPPTSMWPNHNYPVWNVQSRGNMCHPQQMQGSMPGPPTGMGMMTNSL